MTEILPSWKLPTWDGRVRKMAAMVPRGSHVLDLGAGAQTLKGFLPPGCRYDAADIDGPIPFDYETDTYPEGNWDVVVLSGSLEYSPRPGQVLKWLWLAAPTVLVSYCSGGSLDYRKRNHWRSHLSRAGLEQLAARAGWKVKVVGRWHNHVIYRLDRP